MQAEDLARDPRFRAEVLAGKYASELAAQHGVGETFAKTAARLVKFATETHIPSAQTSTEEASDGTRTVEAIRTRPVTLADARAWITATGDDPDDYRLSIRAIAYGHDMFSNRMSATPKHARGIKTWQPITQAAPVTIAPATAKIVEPRDYKLALKCGDTQIGYRHTPDGLEPFHDDRAMDIIVQVARLEQPDKITILGDFLDLPQQGRFDQEPGFALTMQQSINAAYRWLAQLRAAAPNADIVIIEGNHDKRLLTSVQNNAAASFGLKRADVTEWPVMSLPFLLRLDELSIRYMDAYPAATDWDTEDTRNIHGTRANSKGSTASQYAHELPHLNTWFGHTHRAEIIYRTVIGYNGAPQERYSANPGCLCRVDGAVPSVHGSLHADGSSARVTEDWQQGFGILRYTDTEQWPEIVRIRDGKALYQGRMLAA